jgi:glycosyltransferase involved in cell wall biosynthesis
VGTPRLLYLFPVALNLRAHWADRVRAASIAGYDVHVGVPRDASVDNLDLGGANLHHLPIRRGIPSPIGELRLFLAIRRLVRELHPDLLHCVTMRPVVYGGLVAGLLGIPSVVFSLTGLGYLYDSRRWLATLLRPIVEIAMRFAFAHPSCAVIFENPDDREVLVARGLVRVEQCAVFVGGLDLETFAFTAEPFSSSPIVMLPSRLIAEKGVHEFVAAARLLKAKGMRARFVLVGESDSGNPGAIPQKQIESWQREGAVECWGWKDDIATEMRGAAVICLPSYYREGAPRALIEAAAIGRPVVTTDWPGCRDVVVDGETGLLVPARHIHSLVTALRKLLDDPLLRARMGKAARRHAERHFSSDAAVEKMQTLYASLLSAGKTLRKS